MTAVYRTCNRNPRNIYRHHFGRDEDEHVGVMFTPEDGRAAVEALNLWHATMRDATTADTASDTEDRPR